MPNLGPVGWDTLGLVLCLAISAYMDGLLRHFKGSLMEPMYSYYAISAGVFCVGFALKVGLDVSVSMPAAFTSLVWDPVVGLALALMLLGAREAVKFWRVSMARTPAAG